MSLIISEYNENELIDECWYDSSNIYYSKCFDNIDAYKNLVVVFKDGRAYIYKDVIVQDYLLFKYGGLYDSQGKALNSFIKKYKYERLNKFDINLLEEKKNELIHNKMLLENKDNNISVDDTIKENNEDV